MQPICQTPRRGAKILYSGVITASYMSVGFLLAAFVKQTLQQEASMDRSKLFLGAPLLILSLLFVHTLFSFALEYFLAQGWRRVLQVGSLTAGYGYFFLFHAGGR